jgi:hypothetical protein
MSKELPFDVFDKLARLFAAYVAAVNLGRDVLHRSMSTGHAHAKGTRGR